MKPMTSAGYQDHDDADLMIVINRLSAFYNIDHTKDKLFAYIHDTATKIYREHKHDCHCIYLEQGGPLPIPEEFVHKPDEWMELCAYFSTPAFKKKSAQMKAIRNSEKTVNHTAGPTPFSAKGLDYEVAKHPAPYIAAYGDAYEKTDPDRVAQPMAAANLAVAVVGPSAGTRFRCFGNVELREPKRRGPARGSRAAFVDEEARELNRQQADDIAALRAQLAEQQVQMAEQQRQQAETTACWRSSYKA